MPEPQDFAALREVAEGAICERPDECMSHGNCRRVKFDQTITPTLVLALLSEVAEGRALRAAVEALANEWRAALPERRTDQAHAKAECLRDIRALLAAHVPSPLPVGGAAGAGEVGT